MSANFKHFDLSDLYFEGVGQQACLAPQQPCAADCAASGPVQTDCGATTFPPA